MKAYSTAMHSNVSAPKAEHTTLRQGALNVNPIMYYCYVMHTSKFRMRKCRTCGQCRGHVDCLRGDETNECEDCTCPSPGRLLCGVGQLANYEFQRTVQ